MVKYILIIIINKINYLKKKLFSCFTKLQRFAFNDFMGGLLLLLLFLLKVDANFMQMLFYASNEEKKWNIIYYNFITNYELLYARSALFLSAPPLLMRDIHQTKYLFDDPPNTNEMASYVRIYMKFEVYK